MRWNGFRTFLGSNKKNRTMIFKYLCPHQAQHIVAKGITMPFALRGEAQGSINTALAQRAMRLVALTQVKEKKWYRIRITTAVDMADGSTRQHVWKSKSIKYPKGCRTRRDWAAEADFAKGWRSSRERVVGDKSMDGPYVRSIEANEGALSTREKRPRDCHQESILLKTPPEKRGGAREGCGRRKGSYGPKRMRELLHTCEALLKGGMIQCAKEAARGISAAAMLAASVAVEKNLAELTPPYLKQQANRGVDRKSALRKLTKKRLIWEKAILAARACREGWENGVAYFEGVQKECLGAAAPFVGCDTEVSAVRQLLYFWCITAVYIRRCCFHAYHMV